MINLKKFNNCFFDNTGRKKFLLPNMKFDFLYLKINYLDLFNFNFNINCQNVIVEIVNIDFLIPISKELIEKIIKNNFIKRIVLNYKILKIKNLDYSSEKFKFIFLFQEIKFENLAVDFYFGDFNKNTILEIKKFLKFFFIIKHFSIYFLNNFSKGLYVEAKILNFYRYHKYMWAKNNYHSEFGIKTLLEENYLGIGDKAISRLNNEYFKISGSFDKWVLKKILNLTDEFKWFHDCIERLNYYYEITDEELKKKYSSIQKIYKKAMLENNNDFYYVHDFLIDNFFSDNLNKFKP